MDENNQYGNAMTKPHLTGCIKKSKKIPTMRELQLIIEGISHKDKIGHLFVVDIMFDFERCSAEELLFNEIYTPVFEKQKVLPPSKRSVFQLLDAMGVNDFAVLNAYKATAKTHSTMGKKIFIPLYTERLHFLIKCCGWLVTKIYSHFTFEQAMFKKEFVIMNKVSQQNAKTSVEKDFFKLMNNSNFGYYCRKNMHNSFFSPIIGELEEVQYIKRHQNVFDPSLQEFVPSELLEKGINENFHNKIAALDTNSQFYDVRKNSFEVKRKKQLDAVNSIRAKKKKGHKKILFERSMSKLPALSAKSMIEFDTEYAYSIKDLGVKENNQIKPTTRFFSGKMLMFAKLPLKSFIDDLVETFVFPNAITKEIMPKTILNTFIYQILTDTDNTSLQFLIIYNEKSTKNDREYRDVIFEVINSSDIFKRFDTSHKFREKFNARDEKTRKKTRAVGN